MMSRQFTSKDEGERLDRYMAEVLEENRSQVKNAIQDGRIRVNGKAVKAGYRLKCGDRIEYREPEPYVLKPRDLQVPVIYEDEELACVNKPYGLVVHPGAGREEATLVHDLLYRFDHLAEGSDALRPGIVHRLDKDTSGIMVVAKTDRAYAGLVSAFKARKITKEYLAICHGVIDAPGEITSPIGRNPKRRMEMAAGVHPSKPAHTLYQPVLGFRDATLLRVRILTGRTHQIRVHLESIGHGVYGDPIYGTKADKARELLLHSTRLKFEHPVTGKIIDQAAPMPERMVAFIRRERSDQCIKY